MESAETKYAISDNIKIAYQKIGNHDCHMLIVAGWVSNVEEIWNIPQLAAWIKYISNFTSVIVFDKRGTGLSDRLSEDNLPNLDTRIKDIVAILSDIGLDKVNLMGLSEGGAVALKFAHEFPDRVNKVILFAAFAKWIRSQDYPYGLDKEHHLAVREYIYENWGSPIGAQLMHPNFNDKYTINRWAKFLRNSATPASARGFYTMNMKIDIRSILTEIAVPVLVMHRKKDQLIEAGHSIYLREKIPQSELVLLNGNDHLPWFNTSNEELLVMFDFLNNDKKSRAKNLPKLGLDDVGKLYDVKKFLDTNYKDVDISIASLTRLFGINAFKIKTGFKSLFGVPVITYLTKVRMEKAKSILINENETVLSVSEKVGYGYANNFTTAFKRQYGLSPREFIRGKKSI